MTLFLTFEPLRIIRSAWARHSAATRLRRRLEARSDRLLADMGIARHDIAAVARAAFPPVPTQAALARRPFALRPNAA